jgi:hypothetical protein
MKLRKLKSPATKTIEFRLKKELDVRVYKTPEPSYLHVPKWFKDMPRYQRGDTTLHLQPSNLTAKHCVPLMDGFTSGYTLTTAYDLEVTGVDKVLPPEMLNDPNISINAPASIIKHSYPGMPIINHRELELAKDIPTPEGHYPGVWTWSTPMQIITPPGYSVWFMHPANRYDLPFITSSGVIDCDNNGGYGGFIPFFLRKGFEGIIPKGTPIIQIFPFKRENWEKYDSPELENLMGPLKQTAVGSGFYRNNAWTKKTYK